LHSDCSSYLSSSGTVPVYLGDASHLKALLPHPKAAIFVADFNNNYTLLAEYLTYLSNNETAYESHREWRKNFTYEGNIKNKPLLQTSWYCDVCRWAIANPLLHHTKEERLKDCAPAS
jgi:Glycosyltransferase family 10 (fucosyltransferase) C-term